MVLSGFLSLSKPKRPNLKVLKSLPSPHSKGTPAAICIPFSANILPFWNESFKEKGDVSALEKCACTATEIQQCRLYFLAVFSSTTQQNKNMWDQEFKS